MTRNDANAVLDALDAVCRLVAEGVPGVVIGGIAASLLGEARFTADVDVVVMPEPEDIPALLARAAAVGLVPRIEDAPGFAHRHRVLLLRHADSGTPVDLSLAALPFEAEMVRRVRLTTVGGLRVPLPTPEDLIITKAVAHRPVDLRDIETVLLANPATDLRRVRRWVKEFATVLEMPEILADLEAVVRRVRRMRRG